MAPQWTSQTASLAGVSIHYVRTGRGEKPALVLVHGFSDNGLCWAPVARELEADYDIVMPDMRGHGLSSRVGSLDNVDMAADVAGLIRHLGLVRPVVVGHSMGAMVTYQLGIRFPDQVRALVLEDPAWWLPDDPHAPSRNPAENPFVNWIQSLQTKSLDDLLTEYRHNNPTWPDELIRAQADAKKHLDPAIATVMVGKMHSPEAPWIITLQGLKHPLLLLTADPARGAIVTPEVVAEVRRLNPRVQVASVANVGHLIRFDQFPTFMDHLRRFLKSLD